VGQAWESRECRTTGRAPGRQDAERVIRKSSNPAWVMMSRSYWPTRSRPPLTGASRADDHLHDRVSAFGTKRLPRPHRLAEPDGSTASGGGSLQQVQRDRLDTLWTQKPRHPRSPHHQATTASRRGTPCSSTMSTVGRISGLRLSGLEVAGRQLTPRSPPTQHTDDQPAVSVSFAFVRGGTPDACRCRRSRLGAQCGLARTRGSGD
jgi:hypothetical protein